MENPNIHRTFNGQDLAPVTPSDTVDLDTPARCIRCVGTAGTLRFTTLNGQVRNTKIDAFEVLIVGARRIHATGTSATELEVII